MSQAHRKTVKSGRFVAETPAEHPRRTRTTEVLGTKSLRGGTLLMKSDSFSSTQSSFLNSLPGVTEETNPQEREFNKYIEEYSLYLLRALQSRLILKEAEEREEEAKNCLVLLKKEYEELLNENVRLHDDITRLEAYGKSITSLDEALSRGKELLKVLREMRFNEVVSSVAGVLESTANRLDLIDITRKNLRDAFADNLLGFQSDLYKLLKRMELYVLQNKVLIPEIANIIIDVKELQSRNEEMKMRCVNLADKIRTSTIDWNYARYFKIAVDECRDMLEDSKAPDIMEHLRVNLSQEVTMNLSGPCSSSTPHQ